MSNAFVAVLAVGLTVFGLAFIATEVGPGLQEDTDEMTFFDKDIGQVGETQTDTRSIELGSFTVGEGRGDVQAYRRDSAEVSQGRIGSDPITFQYEASQPREGSVSFRVIGREGNGNIYIEVNGERIFEEPMTSDFTGTGSEFTVPQRTLEQGTNNFEIGATRGSLFSPTTYSLENIQAEVNDRDFHDRVETFRMFENEFENLYDTKLSFKIPPQSTQADAPLQIRVNNNTVREDTLARGEYEVELTPENSDLSPGRNTIRFLTFDQAFYEIENSILDVQYSVTTSSDAVTEEITLSDSELRFADREETQEELRFTYTNLNNPNNLQIDLNNETYNLEPENGPNTVELEEDVLTEDNILSMSSDGSFRMENLQLASSVNN
ncbi:MAG: hypothetical protein R6V35_04160 [Candidatus Nanohaloarchaea archaeon]